MKTHELASALNKFSRLLMSLPNMDMSDFERDVRAGGGSSGVDGIAVNIATLAELSRLDKRQWVEFVRACSLPIDVRPRDASRDILGKVLSHLESNADARERLKHRMVESRGVEASPALMKAFGILLRDDDEPLEK